MSNALTSDWDLMQAIRVSAVNEAIAADLKSASPSFPTGFDHTLVYTQSPGQLSVEIAGTFTGWSVVGGSGQNLQLSAELVFSKAVMTENGQTSDLIVWTPGQYSFSATVELSALGYQNDPDGTQKLKTSTGTQIVFAQIYGTPATSTPGIPANTAAAQPYTINAIDFLSGSQINSAFTDWCQSSLAPSVVYCFLAITAGMLNGRTFSWATPTLASYSVNMPGGAGDGVFAQYSMTEGRQPDTPYPVVQGDIIPSGSDALLGVATDRFLTKILQQCLAQNFVDCTAADFAPVYTDTDASMATGLTSTAALTFPTFTLDNGDTVTATIPSGGVQLDIAGDSLQIQMNGIVFECPKLLGIIASGVYVTLNYSCTANLAMSGRTIALNNVAHTLNYSVSYSSAYTWISVGVGVLSVVLVMSGLFSEVGVAVDAAETEAAGAVVSEVEAAGSVDMTAVTGDFSSISADISSGADMSAADTSQMTTVSTEIDAAATNTPVNASGYIVRTLVRTILTAMAGYGAYATVKFQVIGNTVRMLDGGDVTDPITLADFSGDLLSPVAWTNVGSGWSPASAALNDGLGIGLRFA